VSRSSISSSEGPRRGGWLTFAAALVVLLVAAEVALRVPAVRRVLPPRTHFYQSSIAELLDELEAVKSIEGRVDVLFIGSSVVFTDVNPLLFDAMASQYGHLVRNGLRSLRLL
jgi:hypothetical protein